MPPILSMLCYYAIFQARWVLGAKLKNRLDWQPMALRMLQKKLLGALYLVLSLTVLTPLAGQAVALNPDYPERYTVVQGDTLWAVAARFLKEPWRWPEIWKENPHIKNPNLIYPGDVLVLSVVDGKPELRLLRNEKLSERKTVKLSPAIYSQALERAIPTIPTRIIQPFLTQPLVLEKDGLETAGYITIGVDDRLLLGKYDQFYARGLSENKSGYYQIFRPGVKFIHPETKEVLGYQALYLGDARMLAPGDPAKLEITRSGQEIGPTDRLLPAPEDVPLPYYQPHAPNTAVRGRILSAVGGVNAEGMSEIGPATIVVLSLGKRDGVEEGHVLRIVRRAGRRKDPVQQRNYRLPEEDSGLLMVFRTFERVSYALIMKANRAIHVLDAVYTP